VRVGLPSAIQQHQPWRWCWIGSRWVRINCCVRDASSI